MTTPNKRITNQQMTGQKGIALIQRRVLDMGFTWTPTGALEAGIDGYIEIRDDVTGDVFNAIIQVQSKATEETFTAETADSFEYLCEKRDLDYWMQGNAPVILIVSRPRTDEAYWVPIKDYFRDPSVRQARKVRFDKRQHRFGVACKDPLASLAIPRDSGLYLAPVPRTETLYSNLLPVASYALRLYIAETDCRRKEDIWREMNRLDVHVGPEWLLTNKRILSVHDLSEFPWNRICDVATMDELDTEEWADTDDPDRQREWVRILNACLREKCYPLVRYSKDRECYYFTATPDLRTRVFSYQAVKVKAKRDVFRAYPSDGNPRYYRHSALQGAFRRFDGAWHLEITPTYHYTHNGRDEYRYYEDKLSDIKRLEHNDAVMGQVVMWAEFLRREGDMFTQNYPYLSFGELQSFEVGAGIDDAAWRSREGDNDDGQGQDNEAQQLELFS